MEVLIINHIPQTASKCHVQKNYGTSSRVDVSRINTEEAATGYFRDPNLEWFCRISPRITYNLSKKLIFGLEYNLTYAQWAKSIDANLLPVEKLSVNHNNRIEFMAKFVL